jgi:hypothetical protein
MLHERAKRHSVASGGYMVICRSRLQFAVTQQTHMRGHVAHIGAHMCALQGHGRAYCGTYEFRGADVSLDTCPSKLRRIDTAQALAVANTPIHQREREHMFQNDYGEVVEKWKVALILRRAIRMGFRRHDLEDVQQQVVVELLAFTFDPAKSNGASETTVITALIDNTLKTIRRAH